MYKVMIDISVLDMVLINCLSFVFGLGSGIVICFKNKEKLLIVKSRSRDNLSNMNGNPLNNPLNNQNNQLHHAINAAPVMASAPPAMNPLKITVE